MKCDVSGARRDSLECSLYISLAWGASPSLGIGGLCRSSIVIKAVVMWCGVASSKKRLRRILGEVRDLQLNDSLSQIHI
jgi:hypothetical protein